MWVERLHPRDDRGRFSRTAGSRWLTRVTRQMEATRPELFRVHQDPIDRDRHFAERIHRTDPLFPGSVLIDTTGTRKRHTEAGWIKTMDQRIADQTGTGTAVKATTKARATKAPLKAPPPKASWEFRAKAKITDPAQQAKMRQWRADARRAPAFEFPTNREYRMADLEGEVRQARVKLNAARSRSKRNAAKQFPNEPESQEWAVRMDRTIMQAQVDLDNAESMVATIRDDPDPMWERPSTLALARNRGRLKRERPLAIYGDLLHIQGDDEATYRHLYELEMVPAEIHRVVAGWMYDFRHKNRGNTVKTLNGQAGIFVGAVPVPDLDTAGDMATQQPRGWAPGKTWSSVDGAVRGDRGSMLAGHTANADIGGESAVLHELGHAVDYAAGAKGNVESGWNQGYRRAADSPEFKALYERVLSAAGPKMSPYFRQKDASGSTDPGRQEFWAEAFDKFWRGWLLLKDDPAVDAQFNRRRRRYAAAGAVNKEFDLPTDSSVAEDLVTYYEGTMARLGAKL